MGKKRKVSRFRDAGANYHAQITSFQKKTQHLDQNEQADVGMPKGIKPQLVRILQSVKPIMESNKLTFNRFFVRGPTGMLSNSRSFNLCHLIPF